MIYPLLFLSLSHSRISRERFTTVLITVVIISICSMDMMSVSLLLIQLSLEPTKISIYQFFFNPNNVIEVLRYEVQKGTLKHTILYIQSNPCAHPSKRNEFRCLSKWNFAISAMIFLMLILFFHALSWQNPILSVKASPDEASKFCFDHQVYNIG